ncbi:MAG: methylation-associated defense system protein MAD4 [Candidatus Omnitrophota bacterium]
MSENILKKDLIILTADKDMEFSIKGILERTESLRIRKINFNVFNHPHRDPGCRKNAINYLRQYVDYNYALVVFDKEGCGKEESAREELEKKIEEELFENGWKDRSAVIVIDPELENWLWSDSPEVEAALGWTGKSPSLREKLREKGYLIGNAVKPYPPKTAVEYALKESHKPRSSSIYYQIASKVSFQRCQDPAFIKLQQKLCEWFGTYKLS